MTEVEMRIALALLSVVLAAADPEKGANPSVDLRCGSYCLYASLRALGLSGFSFGELEAQLGQPTGLGYSMQQLSDAARGRGAYTLGVRTTLENLERRAGPFACVALLDDTKHYVCIYDMNADRVDLVDPPKRYSVSRAAFSKLWKGEALLVARSPISPVPGVSYTRYFIIAASVLFGALAAVWAAFRTPWLRRLRGADAG